MDNKHFLPRCPCRWFQACVPALVAIAVFVLPANFALAVDDCNRNGIPDATDIINVTSLDCNSNDKPDECEIDAKSPAPGGPFFCALTCDSDCNDNGIPDECDIASCAGDPACSDCNGNGFPDGCDLIGNIVGTNDRTYFEFNAISGSATAISSHGLGGFTGVVGLAFDPNTNTLYGTDVETDQLIRIDMSTGAPAAIGPSGFDRVDGLAFDQNTNTLFGIDTITDQLITINTSTGAGTVVGSIGFGDVVELAFDPNTNPMRYAAVGISATALRHIWPITRDARLRMPGAKRNSQDWVQIAFLALMNKIGWCRGLAIPKRRRLASGVVDAEKQSQSSRVRP